MKKLTYVLCLIFIASSLFSQEKSKWPKVDASVLDVEYYPANVAWRNYLKGDDRTKSPKVKIVYSRTLKKDRDIFGALVPFDKEWRLGANEATEITFYQSVDIGGTAVNPGTYTVFATPSGEKWTINLSSQRGIWGGANRDVSKNVASIMVPVSKTSSSREALSMTFREMDDLTAHLVIEWDDTMVEMPIGFNPAVFSDLDVSPLDMASYPRSSAFRNYRKEGEADTPAKIQVVYSRPYKKDREVFGGLIKTGDIWRIGANQSTEVTFFEDVMIKDLELKRGKYVIYADIKEGSWDIIFSKDYPSWGAANRDEAKDVGRVNVTLSSDSEVLENMSIIFEEKRTDLVHMVIGWDTTRAEIPIAFKK